MPTPQEHRLTTVSSTASLPLSRLRSLQKSLRPVGSCGGRPHTTRSVPPAPLWAAASSPAAQPPFDELADRRAPPERSVQAECGMLPASSRCPVSLQRRLPTSLRVVASITDLPDDLSVVEAPPGGCCSSQLRMNSLDSPTQIATARLPGYRGSQRWLAERWIRHVKLRGTSRRPGVAMPGCYPENAMAERKEFNSRPNAT